jgi:hypothetical protein
LALGAFIVAAIVWTWPLAARLTSRVAHDPGDPILNTWILWWNAQAVPFTERWWNAPAFFPMRDALALSEHLAGLSPISTPLLLAGVSPLGAYNIVLILTFALSGFFTYLLVFRLTGSRLAAVCGGLAYGFSPYRAGQLGHLQVLASFWMPLVLLALHEYVGGGRRRWLIVFAIGWLLQALSNGYYLLFFPVLIALWLVWFVRWRSAPGTGGRLAAVWVAASLPLIPVLLKYRAVHDASGSRARSMRVGRSVRIRVFHPRRSARAVLALPAAAQLGRPPVPRRDCDAAPDDRRDRRDRPRTRRHSPGIRHPVTSPFLCGGGRPDVGARIRTGS